MNRTIIALLFFLFAFYLQVQAQFYRPFPEGEAVWTLNTLHITHCPFGPGWADGYSSYIIQVGDTSINGNMYHKIFKEPYTSPVGGSPYSFADTGYVGAIRQNVQMKQVYIFLRDDTLERLLYDFSVDTVGAAFPNTIQKPNNSSRLTLIDTLWLVNSEGFTLYFVYTDTLTDTCGNLLSYAIAEGFGGEGVISRAGYFIAPGTSNYLIADNIICLSENGGLVLHPNNDTIISHSDSLYCITSLTAGITELPGGYHLQVFPNPASDEIKVVYNDLPSGYAFSYKVFDLLGKLVLEQELQPEGTRIFCSPLTSGLYLWQVMDEQGTKLAGGKLVKY